MASEDMDTWGVCLLGVILTVCRHSKTSLREQEENNYSSSVEKEEGLNKASGRKRG